jgi:hypothetical protein
MRRLKGECRQRRTKSDWMMGYGNDLSQDGEELRYGYAQGLEPSPIDRS